MSSSDKPWTAAHLQPGETARFASTGHGSDLVVGSSVVNEMVLVYDNPEAPPANPAGSAAPRATPTVPPDNAPPLSISILAIDAATSALLDEEETYLDSLMRRYYGAQDAAAAQPQTFATAGTPDPAVAAAKEAVADPMVAIFHRAGSVKLTEIRRMSGRKWTYVRSDKIRNHIRSYSLDVDDEAARITVPGPNGGRRLDRQRILDKATKIEAKIRAEFTFAQGSLTEFMGGWFDELNTSIDESVTVELGRAAIDLSLDAQVLRYYSGASVAAEFDLKKKKIGFKGELKVMQIALAEGKLSAAGYFPHKSGWQPRITVVGTTGGSSSISLGGFRCKVELALKGFAGASVVGGLDAQINMAQGKALIQAAKPGESEAPGRAANGQVASASARVFAGVEVGAELKGKGEWDNPDKRTAAGPSWQEFLSVGGEAAAAGGIGAEAEFTVSYENGRFMLRARAGLVFGGGLKGSLSFTVDARVVGEFVAFVYHRLRDANYRYLSWIDSAAFQAVSRLVARAVADGIDLAEAAGRYMGERGVELFDALEGRRESQRFARNVLHADARRYTTPEAKGMVLDRLMQAKEFYFYAEEPEENAALALLRWVQTRREFQEVCEHLSPGGRKISYPEGRRRLSAFFDGADSEAYRSIRMRLPDRILLPSVRPHEGTDPLRDLFRITAVRDSPLVQTLL